MISCRRWQCERPRPAFCARSSELLVVRAAKLFCTGDAGRAITRCALVRQAQTRFDECLRCAGNPCGFARGARQCSSQAFYC